MIRLIRDRQPQLIALCRAYGVTRLDVFGSAVTGAFRDATSDPSDLDFIAHFDGTREPDYAERFYRFAEALEALFGRQVDLLTERMITNPYFREAVDESRETVVELSDEPCRAPAPA